MFWWIAVTLLWPGRGDFSASGLSTFKKIALTSAPDCICLFRYYITITQYYTCIMAVSVKPAAVSPRSLQLGCRRHGEWEGHPVVIRETAWVRDGQMPWVLCYMWSFMGWTKYHKFFFGGEMAGKKSHLWMVYTTQNHNKPSQIHNEWFKTIQKWGGKDILFLTTH